MYVPPPKALPPKWPTEIPLPSGQVRRMGFPTQIWHFGYLERAQRDQLRAFCTGKSAQVYIASELFEEETEHAARSRIFRAVMIWPRGRPGRERGQGLLLPFVLKEQVELPS